MLSAHAKGANASSKTGVVSLGRGRPATLLMLHDYPPITGGGLALSVRNLASVLEPDFRTIVLSSRLTDHFADDHRIARLENRVNGGAVCTRATPWRLLHGLRTADIVIVHWTFSFRYLSTASIVIGPLLRKPTVCVIHTAPDHMNYNRLRCVPRAGQLILVRWMGSALLRCDAVVALSRSHQAALSQAGLSVTHTLPLPVSAHAYDDVWNRHPMERRSATLGIAGELSKLKGADAILGLIRALTPEFAFRIVGAGPLSANLISAVRSLPAGQRDSVEFAGRKDPKQMPDFYRSIDYLLVLSRTESQCRVAIEAMLAGVIVLARPTSGLVDLIQEGITGFFIDPTKPDAVRDRIAGIVANPSAAAYMRRRARFAACRNLRWSCADWDRLLCGLASFHQRGRGR